MSFSDMDVDITTSHDEGNHTIFKKNQLAGSKESCFIDLMGNNSDSRIQMDKFRSNSECLYCTGQAMDKLLDDPDFMKDFQLN
jgi:hypothetical protein